MSSEALEQEETVTECGGSSDVASARLLPVTNHSDAAKERLVTLARTLGRQAARRHMHRGYSLVEIALCLTLGAFVIAALWYGDILNFGSGHR